MKFLKNTILTVTLFAIGSTCQQTMAKPAGGAKPKTAKTTPKPTNTTKAPELPARDFAGKFFAQLRNEILMSRTPATYIDNATKTLNKNFVKSMQDMASNKTIGNDEMQLLLETARDKFTPFTGDDIKDLMLLNNINTQISNAILSTPL